VFLTSHFAAADPNPVVQEFTTKYRARFKKEPGAMAALGYDVMLVLADVVARAKNPQDRKELKDVIAATKGVRGVTGSIDLSTPDRTPVKDAVVLELKDGEFKYFQTVSAR
jgi:branched-chain amino acid transport system substrate-binding protein